MSLLLRSLPASLMALQAFPARSSLRSAGASPLDSGLPENTVLFVMSSILKDEGEEEFLKPRGTAVWRRPPDGSYNLRGGIGQPTRPSRGQEPCPALLLPSVGAEWVAQAVHPLPPPGGTQVRSTESESRGGIPSHLRFPPAKTGAYTGETTGYPQPAGCHAKHPFY